MNNEFEIGQCVTILIGGDLHSAGESGKISKMRNLNNEWEYLVTIQRRKLNGIKTINVWIVEEQLLNGSNVFA